jgi:hypothetical protein
MEISLYRWLPLPQTGRLSGGFIAEKSENGWILPGDIGFLRIGESHQVECPDRVQHPAPERVSFPKIATISRTDLDQEDKK